MRALVTTALLKADIGDVAGALRAGKQALAIAQATGDTEGEMLTCSRLACNLVATGDEDATDDLLAAVGDGQAKVACIGTAGEQLSVIAAIMNDKTRAAGRSGVGAVMGSKNLKGIVVRGSARPPLSLIHL